MAYGSTRNVTVYIKDARGKGNGSDPSSLGPNGKKNENKAKENPFMQFAKTAVFHNVSEQIVHSAVDNVAYVMNRSMRLADDYKGMRNHAIGRQLVGKAAHLGMTAFYGFAQGGPIGAVAAFSMGALAEGISVAKALDEQRIAIKQSEAQLGFDRWRSGYSLTSDSIGGER